MCSSSSIIIITIIDYDMAVCITIASIGSWRTAHARAAPQVISMIAVIATIVMYYTILLLLLLPLLV